ncbi:MAG TPA: bifunctional polysaccharide deacetylase/glycosyltransferase family 2 protein [Streptosporangiaceae bacterium]|nr:bifunctional polysaccharide deacetylase/glycosyltransferase family 2 protein [Streptosporangiaceae bacterium]
MTRPIPRGRPRDPRGHWALLLAAGLVLVAALLINGFTHGTLGESPRDATARDAARDVPPRAVTTGGPLLDPRGDRLRSARPRPGEIALTFDDGPDPRWTPRLLDVLRRRHARATFFLLGAQAAAHPDLVKRIVREGHEVGSHTYTHIDMAAAPAWRNRLELDLTQRALEGTAGVRTRLLRMPYSSTPNALTGAQWRAARAAGARGYLIALADRDTRDWARPGVNRILAAAARGGPGAVVMLHDAGGDRGQTVTAVDRLLTGMAARGHRFTTMSDALGLPPANVPASRADRFVGGAVVLAQRASDWVAGSLGVLFAVAAALTAVRLGTLLLFARAHARRARRQRRRHAHGVAAARAPAISIVVPAYNEEAGITATVRSLVDTTYPGPIEVIVVDDGSTDQTAWLVDALGLPEVRLICQDNGGKPAALNTGIGHAAHDVLVLVDGDTVFQPDTLGRLVAALAGPDVGAVSGNTKVANRGGLLGRWQHIEYVIGFNLDRRMFDVLECMPTVPGAIGAFRRAALASVGGVSRDTLAEDTDLTMAIRRAGWRVVYEETAVAWTEAPASLRQLWRQRYRWCYGTLQAMWKHRRSVIERGPFGRRCLTYLAVFQVLLPLFAPAVDVFALYGLAFLDPVYVAGSWLVFLLAQTAAGGYALRLDGERLRTLWSLPLQQVVYRQLMYLVVIQSLVTAILGARLRWHVIRRTGAFAAPAPTAARR